MAATEHLGPYSWNNESFWDSFPSLLDLTNFYTWNVAALDATESTIKYEDCEASDWFGNMSKNFQLNVKAEHKSSIFPFTFRQSRYSHWSELSANQ